jgi:hypothetical protein
MQTPPIAGDDPHARSGNGAARASWGASGEASEPGERSVHRRYADGTESARKTDWQPSGESAEIRPGETMPKLDMELQGPGPTGRRASDLNLGCTGDGDGGMARPRLGVRDGKAELVIGSHAEKASPRLAGIPLSMSAGSSGRNRRLLVTLEGRRGGGDEDGRRAGASGRSRGT